MKKNSWKYHFIQEMNFEVRKSNIPFSGCGVFSKTPLPCNARILEYEGKIKQGFVDDPSYLFEIDDEFAIDAIDEPRCLAAMINDVIGTTFCPNCIIESGEGKTAYIKTIKNVSEGEELLTVYGVYYWGRFLEKNEEFPFTQTSINNMKLINLSDVDMFYQRELSFVINQYMLLIKQFIELGEINVSPEISRCFS